MTKKKLKRKNYLKGAKVIVFDHALDQYIARTGVSRLEAERTIEIKFKNSKLVKILGKDYEIRKEVSGSLNKRLTFICQKKGNTFLVRTCFLQGSRNDFWKQPQQFPPEKDGGNNLCQESNLT